MASTTSKPPAEKASGRHSRAGVRKPVHRRHAAGRSRSARAPEGREERQDAVYEAVRRAAMGEEPPESPQIGLSPENPPVDSFTEARAEDSPLEEEPPEAPRISPVAELLAAGVRQHFEPARALPEAEETDTAVSLNSVTTPLGSDRRMKKEQEAARREAMRAEEYKAPGLIWAVKVVSGKLVDSLDRDEVHEVLRPGGERNLRRLNLPKNGWIWMHFDTQSPAARVTVAHFPGLPREACEILAENENGIALEGEDECAWGSLPAFDDTLDNNDRDFVSWRFAMRRHLLVTTRRVPVPVLGLVYRQLVPTAAPEDPAGLIDQVLRDFTMAVRRQLDHLDDDLDRAEDMLLAERQHDHSHMGALLGKVRRRCTELRRVLVPIDRVLQDDDLELPEWAEDALRDRGEQQVHAALDDLLALQDRSRSLQDELASSQAEETNRRLYIVSVATALILPATFVTGFFGMNTSDMFLAHGHWGTLEAGVICITFMVVPWLIMKYGRFL